MSRVRSCHAKVRSADSLKMERCLLVRRPQPDGKWDALRKVGSSPWTLQYDHRNLHNIAAESLKNTKEKSLHGPSLMKYCWSCLRVNVILQGRTLGHLTFKVADIKVALHKSLTRL